MVRFLSPWDITYTQMTFPSSGITLRKAGLRFWEKLKANWTENQNGHQRRHHDRVNTVTIKSHRDTMLTHVFLGMILVILTWKMTTQETALDNLTVLSPILICSNQRDSATMKLAQCHPPCLHDLTRKRLLHRLLYKARAPEDHRQAKSGNHCDLPKTAIHLH